MITNKLTIFNIPNKHFFRGSDFTWILIDPIDSQTYMFVIIIPWLPQIGDRSIKGWFNAKLTLIHFHYHQHHHRHPNHPRRGPHPPVLLLLLVSVLCSSSLLWSAPTMGGRSLLHYAQAGLCLQLAKMFGWDSGFFFALRNERLNPPR